MSITNVSARVLRDFRLAVSGRSFRIALVLSLVVHLAVLVLCRGAGWLRAGGGDRSGPLMHVRLIRWEGEPAAAPRAPEIEAAGRPSPRRRTPPPTATPAPAAPGAGAAVAAASRPGDLR